MDTDVSPKCEDKTPSKSEDISDFLSPNGKMSKGPSGRHFKGHSWNGKETPYIWSGVIGDRERSKMLYTMDEKLTYGPITDCIETFANKGRRYVAIQMYDSTRQHDVYLNAPLDGKQYVEFV